MEINKEIVNYDTLWKDVYGDMQKVGAVHRHVRRILKKIIADLDFHSVLDVGCGAGDHYEIFAEPLLKRRGTFTGIDISEVALERAKSLVRGNFFQLDIQKESLAGQWDLVFCSFVLEHLENDLEALKHMRAMTKNKILIVTQAGDFERYKSWDKKVGHVRNYAPGSLESKMKAAGFKLEKVIYWGFPLYSPLIRTLQNYSNDAGTGQYSFTMKMASHFFYQAFFLNSYRRGDIVFALGAPC